MHTGGSSLHVPSTPHVRTADPTSTVPGSQVKVAVSPGLTPDTTIIPYRGSSRGGQQAGSEMMYFIIIQFCMQLCYQSETLQT